MKALTVKQPWASLIANGIKDVENRTWKTNFRGRILIHSSKEEPTPFAPPSIQNIPKRRDAFDQYIWKKKKLDFPCSHILGSVEIVDCVKGHSSIWAEKDVWNWVLKDAVAFKEPVSATGHLSLWDCPDIIGYADGYSIGDVVPYMNTRQNVRYAKITYLERVENGKVWFHGIDIDTEAKVWYPIHISITLIR